MLLARFLKTIDQTDTTKIFVENVRSFFHIPRYVARVMCEMAVQKGVLEKRVGIACPNTTCGRIIETYDSMEEIPDVITCEICEDGDELRHTFKTRELQKITFYKLIR